MALYLIPSPLGENDFDALFPLFNRQVIQNIDTYIVEDLRTARRFLKKLGIEKPIDSLTFYELNEHTKREEYKSYLQGCSATKHVGLLSDAGTPCIADPGNVVVAQAHLLEIEVIPLIGPNSVMLSLMASGFNGQDFTFNGYLPVDRDKREHKIRQLETWAMKSGQTQIFIETPYRNNHILESILSVCSPATRICVATQVATPEQRIKTQSVAKWRKNRPDLHKQPTIFLIGK
jgi:16S rRNA (cytidine1402-2'-O)-methyltransferase